VCAVTQRTLELPFDSDLKKNFAIDLPVTRVFFCLELANIFTVGSSGGRYVRDRWRRGNSL